MPQQLHITKFSHPDIPHALVRISIGDNHYEAPPLQALAIADEIKRIAKEAETKKQT